LYLNVTVEPHSFFERKGADLSRKLEIPLTTAILGGEITVPTISGKRLALKIAPYTQNGSILRLRGQGMPRVVGKAESERGDLLAQVQIQLPTNLTTEQREALEAFAQLYQQPTAEGSNQQGSAA
jgi:DnaJ-class molecular chaperone